MGTQFESILMDVSTYSAFAPGVCSLLFFKAVRVKNPALLLLLTLTVVVESIASILFYHGTNNLWLYTSFMVIEFALLTAAIQRLQHQKAPVVLIGAFILINTSFAILDYNFINGPNLLISFSRVVTSILLIGLALYAFYDLLRYPLTGKFLGQSAQFWLALAVLVYFSGNLFMFAVTNRLYIQHHPDQYLTWILHSFLNIIYNLLLAKTVLCLKEE